MDEQTEIPSVDTAELGRQLRAELVSFVNAAGARRVLPTVFHLGLPGGRRGRDQIAVPDDGGYDAGLRTDVVERCLGTFDVTSGVAPLPWVTRSGDLVVHDSDVAWAAASREAYARHAVTFPGFFVVTRAGWLNLVSTQATTEQVRRRRRAPRTS